MATPKNAPFSVPSSKGIKIRRFARFYDRFSTNERSRFRRRHISNAHLVPGERVLEVGCGTGTLSVLSRQRVGDEGEVVGVDLSAEMLEQARAKTQRLGLAIRYIEGSIDELDLPDEYFDIVISSLMFHHLPIPVKKAGLKEIRRVLKPGGRLLLIDFARPQSLVGYMMAPMFLVRDFMRVQLMGRLPEFFEEAGFKDIAIVDHDFLTESFLMRK